MLVPQTLLVVFLVALLTIVSAPASSFSASTLVLLRYSNAMNLELAMRAMSRCQLPIVFSPFPYPTRIAAAKFESALQSPI